MAPRETNKVGCVPAPSRQSRLSADGPVLDGIPESFVLGLTVLQDGAVSAAFLVAVVISNLPEAIGATTGLLQNGWSRARVNLLWVAVTAVRPISRLVRARPRPGLDNFSRADVTAAPLLRYAGRRKGGGRWGSCGWLKKHRKSRPPRR